MNPQISHTHKSVCIKLRGRTMGGKCAQVEEAKCRILEGVLKGMNFILN